MISTQKQKIIDLIDKMRTEYGSEAGILLRRVGLSFLTHDGLSTSEDALEAVKNQAKADVLSELFEKLVREE